MLLGLFFTADVVGLTRTRLERWNQVSYATTMRLGRGATYTFFRSSACASFSAFFAAFSTFSFLNQISTSFECHKVRVGTHSRGSLGLIIRLTAANLRVVFVFP